MIRPHSGGYISFYRRDDPSTLWRLYRPVYGLVKHLHRFLVVRPLCGQFFYRHGDPSTLWRLYRPVYGLVKYLHRFDGPSTLWTVLLPSW